MEQGIVVALLAGLGGMLGWGLADFLAKKTIDEIGDVTTLFWGQLVGIFPLALLYAWRPEMPQFSAGQWSYLAMLGVWSGLSYIPTYVAFGKGKVSLLSPIFASYAVLVALFSALVFHEAMTASIWIALAAVFIGLLFMTGDLGDFHKLITGRGREAEHVRGLPEILLATVLYAIWFISLDRFISGRYWVPLLLVVRVFSTFALFVFATITNRRLAFNNRGLWKYLLLIGVFDVAAFASISYGFSASDHASIVAMLGGAFSLPTMVLARTFLKERVTRLQTLGSLVIIAGIMLLLFLHA